MKKLFSIALLTLTVVAGPVLADDTGNSTVSVTVGAEADFTTVGNATLTTAGSTFLAYTGTTAFTYKIRTSQTTGSGAITLKITSDFSPTGGPSVASPPTAGDTLSYTCSVASPGTACSGSQTASTSSETSVATFGADAHSSASGDSGSVSWSLTNDPVYQTGTYSATARFTISAT